MRIRFGLPHVTAFAAALFLAAAAVSHALVSATARPAVAPIWNRLVKQTEAENEALVRLNESYKVLHPDRVRDEARRALLDDAISISEGRTRLMRQLRAAEFGKEDEDSDRRGRGSL